MILQVTPILAIAPLLLVIMSQSAAVLVCAWLVAFFPVLSNTLIGLRSTDHNLLNLFELYGASSWQKLWRLKLPSALPYFLGGLRIAGGLSLIGAVVAELAAGTAGAKGGLGIIVLIAPRVYAFPRAYAALVLLSAVGILIFLVLSAVLASAAAALARKRAEAGELMSPALPSVPASGRYVLAKPRVPACLVDGAGPACRTRTGFAPVSTSRSRAAASPACAPGRRRSMPTVPSTSTAASSCPAFVDMHTHLDKGHIWPRRRNPDGSFFGALDAVTLDRERNWIGGRRRRAHGILAALRLRPRHRGDPHPSRFDRRADAISWPVFAEMREELARPHRRCRPSRCSRSSMSPTAPIWRRSAPRCART